MKICVSIPEEADFGTKIFDALGKICKELNIEYNIIDKDDVDLLITIAPCILGSDFNSITLVLPYYYNNDQNIADLEDVIKEAILESQKQEKKSDTD